MSLDLDVVLNVLRSHQIDGDNLIPIARDLIAAEKQVKAEEAQDKTPKAKTKLVVLIRGDGATKRAVEAGAFVVSVPEERSASTILDSLRMAVVRHNETITKRRASRTIRTFARAMEWLRPKHLKPFEIGSVKTKTPIEVIVVEAADI